MTRDEMLREAIGAIEAIFEAPYGDLTAKQQAITDAAEKEQSDAY